MNSLLRDQLEQAAHTIQTQKVDLQRLQEEAERYRRELDTKVHPADLSSKRKICYFRIRDFG